MPTNKFLPPGPSVPRPNPGQRSWALPPRFGEEPRRPPSHAAKPSLACSDSEQVWGSPAPAGDSLAPGCPCAVAPWPGAILCPPRAPQPYHGGEGAAGSSSCRGPSSSTAAFPTGRKTGTFGTTGLAGIQSSPLPVGTEAQSSSKERPRGGHRDTDAGPEPWGQTEACGLHP